MRLYVLSDLHLEFGIFRVPPVEVDVVILAGDIGIGRKGIRWAAKAFPTVPVIYVAGNHEFYGSNLQVIMDELEQAQTSHVHWLENRAIEIGGVRFLGCSLWTDFRLFGEERRAELMGKAGESMNDYARVSFGRGREKRKLLPTDTAALHDRSRIWLVEELAKPYPGPTVVVTHHAPHPRSLLPEFANDPLSGAYVNDLSLLMGTAQLWIHGHIHASLDYTVSGTRVICNPRGYVPYQANPMFSPGLVLEV